MSIAAGLAISLLGHGALVIDLVPDLDPPPVREAFHILIDETGQATLVDVMREPAAFSRHTGELVNVGTASGVVWLRFDVRNASDRSGVWVLSLNRFLLDPGEIYRVDDEGVRVLLENSPSAFAASYREFGTLGARFALDPGAAAQLYVRYRGGNWSGLDPTITTETTLRAAEMRSLVVFSLLCGGVFSLVLIGAVSFLFIGRQIVVLYALAQLALFAFYAHMSGMTTVYLWPEAPQAGRVVAPIALALYVTAMAQFARVFLDTRRELRRIDRYLAGCVFLGCIAVLTAPLDYLVPAFDRRLPLYLIYLLSVAVWLVLPPLALYATVRWNRDYWPIAVAWSVMGVFMFGLTLLWTGAVPTLPLGKNVYGLVAYVEALFLALAIALRIRQLRREQVEVERSLARSLAAELQTAQRAAQFAKQREWAMEDLAEKGRLLVAAGHDTRQMLSALGHYALGLQRVSDSDRVVQAGREIGEIASSLHEVLTTAIEGSGSGGMSDSILALEQLRPAQILTPLRLVYGSLASEKGLALRMHIGGGTLVSDRVLLSRVLGNIVANALRYTSSGKVLVACRHDGGGHRFQVFDTGVGMSADELARLLDPRAGTVHFTDDDSGRGAGFQIAKDLSSRLGVVLSGRSAPGRGSVFEVRVPQPRGSVGADAVHVVLGTRDGLLEQQVRTASSVLGLEPTLGQGATDLLERLARGGVPSMLMVDQHFGGTDAGRIFAERTRKEFPDVSIVMLTLDRSMEARMRLAGVCDLILYPPVTADVMAAALHLLTGRAGRVVGR